MLMWWPWCCMTQKKKIYYTKPLEKSMAVKTVSNSFKIPLTFLPSEFDPSGPKTLGNCRAANMIKGFGYFEILIVFCSINECREQNRNRTRGSQTHSLSTRSAGEGPAGKHEEDIFTIRCAQCATFTGINEVPSWNTVSSSPEYIRDSFFMR